MKTKRGSSYPSINSLASDFNIFLLKCLFKKIILFYFIENKHYFINTRSIFCSVFIHSRIFVFELMIIQNRFQSMFIKNQYVLYRVYNTGKCVENTFPHCCNTK
jgi:hypothetical protein